jgi:exonuclease SbcD
MAIGQEPGLLLSNVALPAFDYVALGHLHKHQVMSEDPPVVYAGSLERVDFGEEKEDKGFVVADIETGPAIGQRQTSFAFHPVTGRRFLTIDVAIEADDIDPTATVLRAIAGREDGLKDAVVRLSISQPQEAGQLRDGEIRSVLREAHNFTIARDVKREARQSLPGVTAEEITPLEALKAYLESRNVAAEQQKVLLEYGEKLINEPDEAAG